jgi:carbonic anhydrase
MQKLIDGYRRFRASGWPERRKKFASLAENGQKPWALVIACIDSRVDPAMIFDAGPGEIVTLRNVANLVPPYAPDSAYHGTSAALEFSVRVLEVSDLIVLGHGGCGGVRTLLDGAPDTARDFVMPWMSIADRARKLTHRCAVAAERQTNCEYEVVKVSIDNLLTFPWIAARVTAGKLALHGAWFAIHSGELMILQPDGSFTSVDNAEDTLDTPIAQQDGTSIA